ncbi:hypothetical protein L7F22_011115 [Adiantum nelumboides]|nr:hypothetical protein [Adiantum nelumboides]
MSMATMPKRRKIVQGAGNSGATYKRRDVEENGGAEELVDSIVHDLEQENLEKAVDQVAIEREEQGADTQRTQEDDQSEEVVVEQHDQVTEGQHDDEVAEGQHDEEEGQHDDEFAKIDVGELMFSLARLNKMNDYAYVPITFGDRWLLKEIAQHMLDEMPPLASVWTYANNPTFMYFDVKLGRSLSTIKKSKCSWWLDMVKNHVPDEELELLQQHKAVLQLTTTTNSVLEEETTATSQVVASTALASFCKTLPINLGREVVHRVLQANKAIEDGKMQGQHQSASSSGGLRENDDIINETLEPIGTIYVFNIFVEELVHIIKYPQQAEQMGLEVLEALNVVCSQGTVKGTQIDLCIDLIFANFLSNVAVEGCFCNKFSFWNKIGDNLYDTTFQLVCGLMLE